MFCCPEQTVPRQEEAIVANSRWGYRLERVLFGIATLVVVGCDQPETTLAPEISSAEIQRYVTGNAALSLSPQGQFQLPAPRAPDSVPIISPDRARDLAQAFVRTWGPHYERVWSEERGAPIRVDALEPAGRVLYASTPYALFPTGFHSAFRKAYGPWYLVVMAERGTPALMVAVSAYNTDLRIDGHGRVITQQQAGNEFEAWVIGPSDRALRPATPEEAVARIARATGIRTREPPHLLLRDSRQHPASALWSLALERDVRVRPRGGGAEVATESLLVGPNGKVFFAPASQPSEEVTTAIRYTPDGERVGPETVRLPMRPGAATLYVEVNLESESAP